MDSNSEKKNYWDVKPYWCQPWSIITFGNLVLIISWILFNNIIITSILAFIVIIWWVLFLIIAPRSYELISDKK
tara:strand:+ start:347 stop:568 length:222 start_codon:yes stop_codon:yes gene_type:complete